MNIRLFAAYLAVKETAKTLSVEASKLCGTSYDIEEDDVAISHDLNAVNLAIENYSDACKMLSEERNGAS